MEVCSSYVSIIRKCVILHVISVLRVCFYNFTIFKSVTLCNLISSPSFPLNSLACLSALRPSYAIVVLTCWFCKNWPNIETILGIQPLACLEISLCERRDFIETRVAIFEGRKRLIWIRNSLRGWVLKGIANATVKYLKRQLLKYPHYYGPWDWNSTLPRRH